MFESKESDWNGDCADGKWRTIQSGLWILSAVKAWHSFFT